MAWMDRFRPAWRRSDPAVRMEAVRRETDGGILARVALEDENQRVRIIAVGRLEDTGTLARVAATDASEEVCLAAVERLSDDQILVTLAGKSPSSRVRIAAVGRIRDSEAALYLVKQHDDPQVRCAAVRILNSPATLGEIAHRSPFSETRLAAVRQLKDAETLAAIAIGNQETALRLAAVERLRSVGRSLDRDRTRALSLPLIQTPEDQDPGLLAPHFQALGKMEYPRALEAVARSGENHLVRWEAVSRIKDDAVLADIVGTDASDRVRVAAAQCIGHQEEVAGLATSDTHYRVRIAAAGRIENETALMVVCESDPDVRVRLAAASMLSDPALLGHVARNNVFPSVRLAAARKLSGKPFVREALRYFPGAVAGGRYGAGLNIPKNGMSAVEFLAVFDTAVLACLARLDEPRGAALVREAKTDQELARLALTVDNPLVRVAAVERITAPSVLLSVATRSARRSDTRENSERRDFAAWTVMEKLGDPLLLDLGGFDQEYVKTLRSRALLMSIMASDTFSDLRVIAENRYISIVTRGFGDHVLYGSDNIYAERATG
ncbi:MAG: hypothetical protein ABIM40_12170 [Pseudomonadota bacterium]